MRGARLLIPSNAFCMTTSFTGNTKDNGIFSTLALQVATALTACLERLTRTSLYRSGPRYVIH